MVGIDDLLFQDLRSIGEHGAHFFLGHKGLGGEFAADGGKPFPIHGNLGADGILGTGQIHNGIGGCAVSLEAQAEIQGRRRKITGDGEVGLQGIACANIHYAVGGGGEDVLIIGMGSIQIAEVVIRKGVWVGFHFEYNYQVVKPFSTGDPAFTAPGQVVAVDVCREYCCQGEGGKQQHCQQKGGKANGVFHKLSISFCV